MMTLDQAFGAFPMLREPHLFAVDRKALAERRTMAVRLVMLIQAEKDALPHRLEKIRAHLDKAHHEYYYARNNSAFSLCYVPIEDGVRCPEPADSKGKSRTPRYSTRCERHNFDNAEIPYP